MSDLKKLLYLMIQLFCLISIIVHYLQKDQLQIIMYAFAYIVIELRFISTKIGSSKE